MVICGGPKAPVKETKAQKNTAEGRKAKGGKENKEDNKNG